MPIPRDILDQLLSGYLDDVLSADEQTRIEQLLQDDPQVATELEDLRRIRGSLRQISRADAHVRLDDGFVDRVMGAAVTQAQTEGLGDDHPLIKVAEHPNTLPSASRVSLSKIVGGLVALAASIAIAIVIFRPEQQPMGIAGSELAAVSQADGAADPKQEAEATLVTPATTPSPDTMIASADSITDALEPTVDVTAEKMTTDVAVLKSSEQKLPVVDQTPAVESIADNRPGRSAPEKVMKTEMPTEAEAAELLGQTNVLTILVKRSETGRQSRAVREALRGASIQPVQEKSLTEGMVSAISDSLNDQEETENGTQILFLEVPAKKVDVFFARLLADQQGIESVGLALIATPPARRLAQSLSPEGVRAIRHESWQLRGDAVGRLANELRDDSTFLPMRSTGGLPLRASAESDGPDQLARLLILVQ